MSDTKPEPKPIQRHILKAFRVLDVPDKPKLAALAIQTAAGGRHRFVANQQTLVALAKALMTHAKKMPADDPAKGNGTPETGSSKDPQDWFDA